MALLVARTPIAVRVQVLRTAVSRLPPGREDEDTLAWTDARLAFLESVLRSRTAWPMPVREVVGAIGYFRMWWFRYPAGRRVADLLTAIECLAHVAQATSPGARDEPGVYHDLAVAMLQRARLMAAGHDYLDVRA
jgi:hypothetical protein